MSQSHPGSDQVLLMADTDATQSFVFESNKLQEIRGASRQLHDLNKQIGEITAAAGGRTIYAGGGGLLALVPPGEAPDLVAQIETLYPGETGGAAITAVSRPLPPNTGPDAEFGAAATWLSHILRHRKEDKAAPPFWETLPYQSRCPSCQHRPASATPRALCLVCQTKRNYSRRGAWFGQFARHLTTTHDYFRGKAMEAHYPQDLSEIGAACPTQPGYVGFLYLDGDEIGRRLTQIGTAAQYESFSRALEQTTMTAVFDALAAHLRLTQVAGSEARRESEQPDLAGESIWIHPFEIITIGGDDVLLITPAHVALPIARTIGQNVGEAVTAFAQTTLNQDEPLTFSAGVVLAEHHTPIRIMRDLAGQLLAEAKSHSGGALDFLALKSADMPDSSVAALRQDHPYYLAGGDRRSGKALRLLGRPYSYAACDTLWTGLKNLRGAGFPTSQMHQLAQSLLDGRRAATLFYEYQRRRESNKYGPLHELLTALQPSGDDHPLPWQRVDEETVSYRTALWDLAELYDFVHSAT